MNMKRGALIRLACLAFAALPAIAQNSLEIIGLRHRTAEQVIPALKPLVEPGGTLSGQGMQLFVRTSPANLAELRRALASIDQPAKRLLISVRFDDSASRSRSGIDVRQGVESSSRSRESHADQMVQVLDGGRAMIMTGQSRPVQQQGYIQTPGGVVSQPTTVVQETASGFEVVPRVAGKNVQVEIVTQNRSSGVSSTVSGPLGQWFELGSVAVSGNRDRREITGARSTQTSETRRVWIKVDELP
jgi:hypothetical protein